MGWSILSCGSLLPGSAYCLNFRHRMVTHCYFFPYLFLMIVILWTSQIGVCHLFLGSLGISNTSTGCNKSVAVASTSFTINLRCCLFVVELEEKVWPIFYRSFPPPWRAEKQQKLGRPHYQKARGIKRATLEATSGWPTGLPLE